MTIGPDIDGATEEITAARACFPSDPTGVVISLQSAHSKMGEAEAYPESETAWQSFDAAVTAVEATAESLDMDWDEFEAALDEAERAFDALVTSIPEEKLV